MNGPRIRVRSAATAITMHMTVAGTYCVAAQPWSHYERVQRTGGTVRSWAVVPPSDN
jgi:hypothetical protein